MAYPIKEYLNMFDSTYRSAVDESGNRGQFGHLVIRDSNTAFKDYVLVGINHREDTNLDEAIRLNATEAKRVIRALNKFLKRIGKSN